MYLIVAVMRLRTVRSLEQWYAGIPSVISCSLLLCIALSLFFRACYNYTEFYCLLCGDCSSIIHPIRKVICLEQ